MNLKLIVFMFFYILSAHASFHQYSFFSESEERHYYYVVFEPQGYDDSVNWPVILYLHGAHERGQEGWKHTQVGLAKVLHENPELYPALVVMPQIHENQSWTLNSEGLKVALKALQLANQIYSFDPQRIYLTGFSMGAYGVWDLASYYPNFFAALIPIAAHKYPDERSNQLRDTPIWAHHSQADQICDVQATRSMVEFLRNLGSSQVRYTESEGFSHRDSCEHVYRDLEVIHWLLDQKK